MNKCLRYMLQGLLLLVSSFAVSQPADQLNVLTHTSLSDVKPLALSSEQHQWLEQKKVLRMGVYNHDTPPFSLITYPNNYEGLNADYISIIGQQLGLKIQLVTFQNMAERLHALQNDEIDIIPNANADYGTSGLSLTVPYSIERPVFAVNINMKTTLPADLEGVTVAVTQGYWPLTELKRLYPKAQFQLYDNYQEALSAVAYGKTQAYLGTVVSISRNFSTSLRIERSAFNSFRNNSFALNKTSPLATLINSALNSIPQEKN